MENSKLKYFKKEHGFDMPIIKHLSINERSLALEKLSVLLGVNSIEQLQEKVDSDFTPLDGYNANEKMDFFEIFHIIQIPVLDNICIINNSVKDIDLIAFDDFNKYIEDIWYPSSDDKEIFDFSYQWVISIRHWGGIYLYKQFL